MPNSSEMKSTKEHLRKCRGYQRSLREHIDALDHFMDDDFFKNPRRCWDLLQKEHQEQYSSQYLVPAERSGQLLLQEGGLEPSNGKRRKFAGTIWRLLHPDRHGDPRHNNNRSRAGSAMGKRSDPIRPVPAPRPSSVNIFS
ncbi:uncharacterized protein LOC111082277 [Drosophila obscura]|uniref:uncharacterized protein LOC111082277 n=1 Tax=Drosophila obscura TaxID=7282 RepID=UPI001BB13607|nr:uncharacterized protein LOC111082277 [Drosophila obscura]